MNSNNSTKVVVAKLSPPYECVDTDHVIFCLKRPPETMCVCCLYLPPPVCSYLAVGPPGGTPPRRGAPAGPTLNTKVQML